MKKQLFFIFTLIASASVGCAQKSANRYAMNSVECGNATTCYSNGALTISSDGHGFIGVLETSDGKCINVSLPEEISKRLLGKPPKQVSIHGKVLPYLKGDDILFFKVNHRRVGYGTCGNYFVFVE